MLDSEFKDFMFVLLALVFLWLHPILLYPTFNFSNRNVYLFILCHDMLKSMTIFFLILQGILLKDKKKEEREIINSIVLDKVSVAVK